MRSDDQVKIFWRTLPSLAYLGFNNIDITVPVLSWIYFPLLYIKDMDRIGNYNIHSSDERASSNIFTTISVYLYICTVHRLLGLS